MISEQFGTYTKSYKWDKRTKPLAEGICSVLDDMSKYRPLTVRQIYYQLVSKLIIPNNLKQYKRVSRTLVQLRELDIVPWSWIIDRTRRTTTKRGQENVLEFIELERENFMLAEYYSRCYVQRQDVYVEVSTEKDALSSIMEDVTYPFCTRLNVVRGQVSATLIEQIAVRMEDALMKDRKPILLHMGDLDPSGIAIPRAIKKSLSERHYIDVDVRIIALNPEQVAKYKLPEDPEAIKVNDPNLGRWLRRYGPDQSPVELDALRPEVLQSILKDELSKLYDMSRVQEQVEQEKRDRDLIRQIRNSVMDHLDEQINILCGYESD